MLSTPCQPGSFVLPGCRRNVWLHKNLWSSLQWHDAGISLSFSIN